MKISLVHLKFVFILVLILALYLQAQSQIVRTEVPGIPINCDEAHVPAYSLPDPLIIQN